MNIIDSRYRNTNFIFVNVYPEPSEDSPTVMEDEEGATESPVAAEEGGEVGASSKTNGAGEEPASGEVKPDLDAENEGLVRPRPSERL